MIMIHKKIDIDGNTVRIKIEYNYFHKKTNTFYVNTYKKIYGLKIESVITCNGNRFNVVEIRRTSGDMYAVRLK